MMKRATIESIRNLENGKLIKSSDFFKQHSEARSFELRRILKESAQDGTSSLVCDICLEAVTICGGPNQELHFRHHKDGPHCSLKTKNNISHKEIDRMKYNGAKESKPHKEIKEHLYLFLSKDPYCFDVHQEKIVEQEKVSGERWWKKPDISAIFKRKEIIIEIQLSTTFLDVIIEREHFYQKKGAYILWVFDERELGQYRFSEKDIFYTHNRNAFIVNKASKTKSAETGVLHLTCCYQKPICNSSGDIVDEWIEQVISIHDLTFDQNNYHLIYSDYQEQLLILEEQREIKKRRVRQEAIEKFENYWINERDHGDDYSSADRDNEFLAPLLNHIENYHVNIPFDYHLSKILSVIYSVKSGDGVGYNMQLLQVINIAFQCWPQYGVLFYYALDHYGHWNNYKNKDSIRKKIKVIKEEWTTKQDKQYNEFLILLFPKITERFNDHIVKYK